MARAPIGMRIRERRGTLEEHKRILQSCWHFRVIPESDERNKRLVGGLAPADGGVLSVGIAIWTALLNDGLSRTWKKSRPVRRMSVVRLTRKVRQTLSPGIGHGLG